MFPEVAGRNPGMFKLPQGVPEQSWLSCVSTASRTCSQTSACKSPASMVMLLPAQPSAPGWVHSWTRNHLQARQERQRADLWTLDSRVGTPQSYNRSLQPLPSTEKQQNNAWHHQRKGPSTPKLKSEDLAHPQLCCRACGPSPAAAQGSGGAAVFIPS